MLTVGAEYYNKLQQFLIYKGKKSKTENIFRDLLLTRAKKNKKDLAYKLYSCKYKIIPYVRLKTKHKRRGKRVFYRVTFLEKNLTEKKSVSNFGNHIRKQIGKKLGISLEKEIENLHADKNHIISTARNKLHRLAKKYAPRIWTRKKNYFFKRAKRIRSKLKRKAEMKNVIKTRKGLWYRKWIAEKNKKSILKKKWKDPLNTKEVFSVYTQKTISFVETNLLTKQERFLKKKPSYLPLDFRKKKKGISKWKGKVLFF